MARPRRKQTTSAAADVVVPDPPPNPKRRRGPAPAKATARDATPAPTPAVSPDADRPLLDLGLLEEGVLLRRPSSRNRSPYVGDVEIVSGPAKGSVCVTHLPNLDSGGKCRPGARLPVPPPTRRRTGHRRTLRHPEVRARVPTPPVRRARESRAGSVPRPRRRRRVDQRAPVHRRKTRRGAPPTRRVRRSTPRARRRAVAGTPPVADAADAAAAGVHASDFRVTHSDVDDVDRPNRWWTRKTRRRRRRAEATAQISASRTPTDPRAMTLIESRQTGGGHGLRPGDGGGGGGDFPVGKRGRDTVRPWCTRDRTSARRASARADVRSPTTPRAAVAVSLGLTHVARRAGIFPWGKRGQKGPDGEAVVSARAIEHLRELTHVARRGGETSAAIAPDARLTHGATRRARLSARPNGAACPSFARHLAEAEHAGVRVLAHKVRWGEGEEAGRAFDGGPLPMESAAPPGDEVLVPKPKTPKKKDDAGRGGRRRGARRRRRRKRRRGRERPRPGPKGELRKSWRRARRRGRDRRVARTRTRTKACSRALVRRVAVARDSAIRRDPRVQTLKTVVSLNTLSLSLSLSLAHSRILSSSPSLFRAGGTISV